jgi:5-formyltetrahydrofolate cyclo-ligase
MDGRTVSLRLGKQKLRTELLEKRRNILESDARKASQIINDKVIDYLKTREFQSVHIYKSSKKLNEVDTTGLIKNLAKSSKNTQLTVGQSSKNADQPSRKFDVIIMPVLGFDKHNNRLGMGGGWYDKWLTTQTQAIKIGLAYKSAQLTKVPTEPHDAVLDKIFTD